MWALAHAFEKNYSVEQARESHLHVERTSCWQSRLWQVYQLTKIDRWFLAKLFSVPQGVQ